MELLKNYNSINFKLKELVSEDALEAYFTYVKLTEYSSLSNNADNNLLICDDYNLRNYSYPMGLWIREV